jgi:threonine dehydrogenase-like Zn-dependent dehydrogenase
MTNETTIPTSQYAVQLVGPDELKLNTAKPVDKPGPWHILAKVEAVGLCFSDLKLLHQFAGHARKQEVISGVGPDVLAELPSYAPGTKPTVPGHEACVRVVAVGDKVQKYQPGRRYLVQADWRQMLTPESNGAFGYCFEGALQEYVIMDERILVDRANECDYLVPADEQNSASAVALVEPWACVECSYISPERRSFKPGGKLLIVAEPGHHTDSVDSCVDNEAGHPSEIIAIYGSDTDAESFNLQPSGGVFQSTDIIGDIASLPDETYDDIVYFGARAQAIETLNDKLARGGIINIVLCGEKIGRAVSVGVGRVHYGLTRWIGTTGTRAADAYEAIPKTGEIRNGENIVVIGAGGPMGQMHVIRDLCLDRQGMSMTATDFDDERLESLRAKAKPLAQAKGYSLQMVNPKAEPSAGGFTYYALMAPIGALVAEAVDQATPGALINIFAGIPAPVKQDLNLDAYIAKKLFMFGTSGSLISDIITVRDKMQAGELDTNLSLDAVCGMAGALDGIEAVKNRALDGKIVVYPQLHELGLVPLRELGQKFPTVEAKMDNALWTAEAEEELLKVAR